VSPEERYQAKELTTSAFAPKKTFALIETR